MFKSVTTLALAGVIAVTTFAGSAAPARADNDDLARFLFGAAALAIIAGAVNDHHNDNVVVVKPHKPQKHAKYLPASCRTTVQRSNGKRFNIYTQRCLQKKGYMPIGAPDCRRTAVWNGKKHVYFPASCLRQKGFAV